MIGNKMAWHRLVLTLATMVACLPAWTGPMLGQQANSSTAPTRPADWPCWRGPGHDGVSTETGWATTWPKDGPKVLWQAELGPGFSSVSIVGGKLYSMGSGKAKAHDTVYCLNADTGEIVWTQSHPCTGRDSYLGPRATPAVDGKSVYALGMDGQAYCLDGDTGQIIWDRNLKKDLGVSPAVHGFTSSPVVEGNLVLLNMGGAGLALDKGTGRTAWSTTGPSSYSSPVPLTLGSRRCAALLAATQLAVVDVATGRQVSACDWPTAHLENTADPIVVGDRIFVTSAYGQGCALLDVSGDKASTVWTHKKFQCHFANPVRVGGCVYGLAESGWVKADLACLDLKDGAIRWRQKGIDPGALAAIDGKLLVLSRRGELILAEASPAAYVEIARARVFPAGDCSIAPVLCGGRIYVKNDKGTLICLDARPNIATTAPAH